jgi:rare lipoprotein A
MYKATMKPYTVKGVTYYPIIPRIGQTFTGIGSWYGPDFHGGKTSNGEYYDMHDLTAAHKTLPMNTTLKVTNLSNGRSTIVRINDRGPFVDNRIIDLSYQAAQDIGMIKKGTAKVKLEVLDYDQSADAYKKYKPFAQAKSEISQIQSLPKQTISPIKKMKIKEIKNTQKPKIKKRVTYKVQILSSTSKEKADLIAQKYATIADNYHSSIRTKNINGKTIHRVIIGDFKDKKRALSFILNNGFSGALLIKD